MQSKRQHNLAIVAIIAGALGWSSAAEAVDLPKVGDSPVQLDVTETSIVAQRFNARDGEKVTDQGFGAWLNRLNLALKWKRFTVGARLDSSAYWLRPEDRDVVASDAKTIIADGASRFRDSIYPAKLWVTYLAPGLEVTVGDAYVQFGRGLILSMRKIDELGIDTTLRGVKVAWQSDPFAAALVAGFGNPSRIDEPTGRALLFPKATSVEPDPQPLFGSDRIIGAEIQAGRGLPITLTTHAVRVTRCAPYRYDAKGNVVDKAFDAPLGSCDPVDTTSWLSTLPKGQGPTLNASEIYMVGQGFEIPSLWGHGKLYVEGAIQHRFHDSDPDDANASGNALYASLSTDAGPVTNTLELKSYRNFFPVSGGVNTSRASAFSNVAYSTPPTGELVTQDSAFGFANACIDGGRLRSDVRLNDGLLVYGTAAYFYSKSEVAGGGCDRFGKTLSGRAPAESVQSSTWDGVSGIEWSFDGARSHVFASGGVRNDTRPDGSPFYRELHAEYALVKHIAGPFSFEMAGRHRLRRQELENLRAPTLIEQPWREGEHYTSLNIAPKWGLSQGIEYTTRAGLPTTYFNGSVLYRFTTQSNIRVLVGQQRGGLRCVSGVCRVFPAFEGARAEITIRF